MCSCTGSPPKPNAALSAQLQKVSPSHRNSHFSQGKTRVAEVRFVRLHVFVTKIMEINGPEAFWAHLRSFGCADRLEILIQSASFASPGAFWPYIRSFGCAKCLEILIQSANLASTVAILCELVALGAQTDIIIDFTLLQKPVCGPISVVIHPSIWLVVGTSKKHPQRIPP